MEQLQACKLDLTKISGDGEFPCPKCGAIISPDDTNKDTYHIIEPKVNSQGLSEIVLACNKCGSQIHLTGFALLQELRIF